MGAAISLKVLSRLPEQRKPVRQDAQACAVISCEPCPAGGLQRVARVMPDSRDRLPEHAVKRFAGDSQPRARRAGKGRVPGCQD